MLISNYVKDGIIDHDEFLEILKEKKQYDCLKNKDKVDVIFLEKYFFLLL